MAEEAPRQVALTLVLGPRGAERIADLRRRIRGAGLPASDVAPHVTLAVVEDADPTALARAFTAPPPDRLEMVHLGAFPGPPGVVFLGVAPAAELVRLHEETWEAVAALGRGSDRYRPGWWVPHCTLAMPLAPGDIGRAVDCLAAADLPFTVDVSQLAVADVASATILFTTWG
jgi:2'-5' RNA ligase